MAITREEAARLLQSRGYNLQQLQPQPEQTNYLSEFGYRPVARAARTTLKGLASIADLVNLPVNAARGFAGQQPLQSPSELVGNQFDRLTGGIAVPQNGLERVTDTAGEFITGAGPFAAAGKVSSIANKLTPKSLSELFNFGAAGAGSESLNQAFPENPAAPLIGALAGASALPLATKAASIARAPTLLAENKLTGIDLNEAIQRKQAGNRIGIDLTPAEASGNPFVAANQGRLGVTAKGAQKMYEFGKTRKPKQVNAIEGLYNDVAAQAESNLSPDEAIRRVANNIIDSEKKVLQNQAKPFYERAESQTISNTDLNALLKEDGNIEKALRSVLKDPLYKSEIKDASRNSLKVLDLAKRNIDDQIGTAMRAGESNKVRLLNTSKNRLVEALDKVSPDYKKGRSIYAEGNPAVKAIENSAIGKIAGRKDLTIKNIGKDIFDRQQTNPKVFNELRDRIYKEDPKAWDSIVRQEMERRAGSSSKGGSNFYKKVLEDDKSYNQFYEALSKNPAAQSKLADMKEAFQNLIEPVTAKTAASQAKSSLDVSRSSAQSIKQFVDKVTGGFFDRAAIDLITNPKWDKKLLEIQRLKSPEMKAERLESILSIVARQLSNPGQSTSLTQEDLPVAKTPSSNAYMAISREDAAKILQSRGYNLSDIQPQNTQYSVQDYLNERNR